jgi:hypothetical protein
MNLRRRKENRILKWSIFLPRSVSSEYETIGWWLTKHVYCPLSEVFILIIIKSKWIIFKNRILRNSFFTVFFC